MEQIERFALSKLIAEHIGKTNLVDYLLANGVVVLPCKVGDTVYQLCNGDYEQFAVTDITIHMSGKFLVSAECDIHGHGFYNHQKCKEEFWNRRVTNE